MGTLISSHNCACNSRLKFTSHSPHNGYNCEYGFNFYEEFMKKIVLTGMAILLVGCSALPNINLPFLQQSTPVPEIVNSPAPTVTLVSDSWTNTPDLFATNTPGPTDTPESGTPHPTSTKTPFPTIPPTARS